MSIVKLESNSPQAGRHKFSGSFRMVYALVLIMLQYCMPATGQDVRINELMADNSTVLADEDGDFSDWIELFNPSAAPIPLLNWSLTDDPNTVKKWQLPAIDLPPFEYLVIFASGKDRKGSELHTNFKLAAAGEYLALVNSQGTVISAFDPSYPALPTDVSFALLQNDYVLTATPTPGSENAISMDGILAPKPQFSHTPGFYGAPFDVTLSTPLSGAVIIYTTDGSAPGELNGINYGGPITISTTTVLRAAVKRGADIVSPIATQTYLFLNDVVDQSNAPPGYPNTWGPYAAIPGTAIADYGMDPDIAQDPAYAGQMIDALRTIPTLSIVTDKNNLFNKTEDENTGGIYIYTGAPGNNDVPLPGDGWERPASVELFNVDGTRALQIDCGIRLQGGHSRRAEKSPKHSFRLVFKSKYGSGRLTFANVRRHGNQ